MSYQALNLVSQIRLLGGQPLINANNLSDIGIYPAKKLNKISKIMMYKSELKVCAKSELTK